MTDLRNQIARAAWKSTNPEYFEQSEHAELDWALNEPTFLQMADAVLALPAISAALQPSGEVDRAAIIEECALVADRMSEEWFAEGAEEYTSYAESDRLSAKSSAADAVADAIRAMIAAAPLPSSKREG